MHQLPKIVTERLRATSVPGSHPDADLLAAFAENALRESEQCAMLEHLAVCAECREIISLTEVEVEMLVPAAVASPPQAPGFGWLRWPVLRWGAVAACVVVVGATIGLRYRSQEKRPGLVASKTDLHITVADEITPARKSAELQPPASNSAAPAVAAPSKTTSSPSSTATRRRPALRIEENKLAAEIGGKLASRGFGSLAAPTAPDGPVVSDKKDAKEKGPFEAPSNGREEEPISGARAEAAGNAATEAAKARGAPAQSAGGTSSALSTFKPHTDEALVRVVAESARRWTISNTGKVLRSLDAGNTWHEVSVGGEGTFRALSVLGPNLWVGGNQGELYHSSDDGEHWAEIKLTAEGKALTSDIVHIEFENDRQGTLTTATRETWSTSDGGITWQKK